MKYIRKTAGVEAFQVTLDRITQTINSNKGLPVWLVKALNKSPDEIYSVYCKDGKVYLRLPTGKARIFHRDWIVQMSEGVLTVYSDAYFRYTFAENKVINESLVLESIRMIIYHTEIVSARIKNIKLGADLSESTTVAALSDIETLAKSIRDEVKTSID